MTRPAIRWKNSMIAFPAFEGVEELVRHKSVPLFEIQEWAACRKAAAVFWKHIVTGRRNSQAALK